jgi:hypothetical protein
VTISLDAFDFPTEALDAMPVRAVRDRDDAMVDLDVYLPSARLGEYDPAARPVARIGRWRGRQAAVGRGSHTGNSYPQRPCRPPAPRIAPRRGGITTYCQRAHNTRRLRVGEARHAVLSRGPKAIRGGGIEHALVIDDELRA